MVDFDSVLDDAAFGAGEAVDHFGVELADDFRSGLFGGRRVVAGDPAGEGVVRSGVEVVAVVCRYAGFGLGEWYFDFAVCLRAVFGVSS